MNTNDKLKQHIDALERLGYTVKKRTIKTKTHTFIIDVDTLKAFQDEIEVRKLTVRQALNEAINLWIRTK